MEIVGTTSLSQNPSQIISKGKNVYYLCKSIH